MEYKSQDLDSHHKSRSRTAEICVRIHRPDSPILHRRQFVPAGQVGQDPGFLHGAPRIEAAGHKDEYFGGSVEYIFPGQTRRRLPRSGKELLAPGDADHLGDPVSRGEERVQPLYTPDARAATFSRTSLPHPTTSPTLIASRRTSLREVGFRESTSGSFFRLEVASRTRSSETAHTSQRPWVMIRSGDTSSKSFASRA